MITSKDNQRLKLIRRLAERRHREREGLFVAEGEDLIEAAALAGREPAFVLRSGEDVEPELLDAVSTLGSGTRAIGVYPKPSRHTGPARPGEPGLEGPARPREPAPEGRARPGEAAPEGLCVYLHAIRDPGNVGAVVRTTHALIGGGTVVLGPGCADPYSPKAVRASMGSIFSLSVIEGEIELVPPPLVGLVAHGGEAPDDSPVGSLCLGAERAGLPDQVLVRCERRWTIPLVPGGAESLNVATAAAIALGRISSAAPETTGGSS
jgi:RNA methyltransferase, TrmH family